MHERRLQQRRQQQQRQLKGQNKRGDRCALEGGVWRQGLLLASCCSSAMNLHMMAECVSLMYASNQSLESWIKIGVRFSRWHRASSWSTSSALSPSHVKALQAVPLQALTAACVIPRVAG
jgi:hypothetical protein